MRIELLDYELPNELIAQSPTAERDGSRLLVVDPENSESVAWIDSQMHSLAQFVPEQALFVLNDTRVVPARLFARKETGGKVEIFLVRKEQGEDNELSTLNSNNASTGQANYREVWRALGRSSKPLNLGQILSIGDDFSACILERAESDGLLRVLLTSKMPIEKAINRYGHVPLPPYIKRHAENTDAERYQTVFARQFGAIAAPTAGLHFSQALLGRLTLAGVQFTSITLHVGLGTFQPVQVEDLDQHPMHKEEFAIDAAAAAAINEAKRDKRPIIAVGTTVVRALETAALLAQQSNSPHTIEPCSAATNLLIQPGFDFQIVNGLITNFHLPKSTLLALVAAFIGLSNMHFVYRHAIEEKYRFFSYGDAMFLRKNLT